MIKDQLRRNTEDAVSEGAPGLPWIVATDRNGKTMKVWGFDHLGQILAFVEPGSKLPPML